MWLPLSLERHILARVFGDGSDGEGGGLVAGKRDLQRQRLKLKWQEDNDTELGCMRQIIPALGVGCNCGSTARKSHTRIDEWCMGLRVRDATIGTGRIRNGGWNAGGRQQAQKC